MAFEAGVVQRRAALAGSLVDGGVRGKQQLHATVPAFVAGSVLWRGRGAVVIRKVDSGVGGEE